MSRLLSILALLLVACATSGPTDPPWGKIGCSHCGMLVSDRRFAAQVVDVEGERRFFDDIGCLAAWTSEHAAADKQPAWVRAVDRDGWIPLIQARFRSGFATPMDSGWAAVAADGRTDWSSLRLAIAARRNHGDR